MMREVLIITPSSCGRAPLGWREPALWRGGSTVTSGRCSSGSLQAPQPMGTALCV